MGVTPIIYVTFPPEAEDGNSTREDHPSDLSDGAVYTYDSSEQRQGMKSLRTVSNNQPHTYMSERDSN